jgi:hypothetical protein
LYGPIGHPRLAVDACGDDDGQSRGLGDGAVNQGTFAETLNLAALWSLPIVFMVVNNLYGMGTAVERHSAQPDMKRRGESLGARHPLVRDAIQSYLDAAAGTAGGPLTPAQRAAWVAAYREISKAAANVAR